jgi:ribosomal-protein-alanine N-acetyltransferase
MTREFAAEIDEWRYDPPYDFYDLRADPEDRAEFLDPGNWPGRYYAVTGAAPANASGASDAADSPLVGFFCFEPDGDAVTVGLGMRPVLTGRGHGRSFVEAGLSFAAEAYDPGAFELAVARFNERAIAVYEDLGFERVGTATWETNGGEYEFVEMRRAR